jgi:maleate isomerase
MSLEYAPRGLVGMLTPQANTTVEPEFNLLWPPGVAMINARLMSDKPSMSERLVDYFDNYGASLRQFANAPVGVCRRGVHRRVLSRRTRTRGGGRGGH